MSTEFGEKLAAAIEENKEKVAAEIEERKNDIASFVWKGMKTRDTNGNLIQDQIRLIDATEDQLRSFAKHCTTMLFNDDKKHPGRVNLLKEIGDQRDRCGVELFYRDAKNRHTSNFAIVDALRNAISNQNLSTAEVDDMKIGDLLITDSDFQNLPVKLIIDGGLDKLGRFDRSHITLSFIIKQGVWLTKDEYKEFGDKFINLKNTGRAEFIKAQLRLPENVNITFSPLGLTFNELKCLLALKTKKYTELSTEQLEALRYKLLFALEDEVSFHINQWNERLSKIDQVATFKGFTLN